MRGGLSRFLGPLVFIAGGLSFLYWFALNGPSLPGWQAYVPWAMGGLFVVVGITSIVRDWRRGVAREEARRSLEAHREAPWRVRPEWREARLVAESGLDRSFVAFTVVWNLVAWLFVFLVWGGEGEGAAWLVAFFPLVGLGLLGGVAHGILRERRFGSTVLTLDTMPGRLGHPFQGTLEVGVGRGALPERGFLVKVSCYRQRVRYGRDSEGRRRKRVDRDLLWRDETRVEGRPFVDGSRAEVPFSFRLPEDRPASTPLKTEERVLWEVSAEAEVPGVDFAARVEVPVFPSDEPADAAAALRAASPRPEAEEVDREPDFDGPVTDGIELIEDPQGLELHFTASRNRRSAILLGVIGVGLLVGGGFVLAGPSVLWGLVILGMGGLLGFGSVQQATNDTVLRIRDGRIEVTHDGVGMPADVDFPAGNLVEVLVHLDPGSSGENAGYSISLVADAEGGLEHLEGQARKTADLLARFGVPDDHPGMEQIRAGAGRPRVLVAGGLTDKVEADWLASRIRSAVRR